MAGPACTRLLVDLFTVVQCRFGNVLIFFSTLTVSVQTGSLVVGVHFHFRPLEVFNKTMEKKSGDGFSIVLLWV